MIQSYKNWINNSYSQIKENYVEINNLDQKLGDGDHGSTILKGLDTAVANLNIISSEDLSFFMSEISKLMRISMGGASGILMTIFIKEYTFLWITTCVMAQISSGDLKAG